MTRSLLLTSLLCLSVVATAAADDRRSRSVPDVYALPIEKGGCGGFCTEGRSMYLFQYEGRQLYEVSSSGRLLPRENVSGWYVVDAAVIDGAPIYCSRNRVFRKFAGKIKVNPIPDSEKLISIACDEEEIFLLEAAPKSTIIVLGRKDGRVRRRLQYDGRNPADLVAGDGSLWLLDRGDRCIHRVDRQTGSTTLKFQAGPGVENFTRGLLYRNGELFVHEGDYARLRRVEWKRDGHAIESWSAPLRMAFVQESWNEHDSVTTNVRFWVPVPPTRHTQTVGDVEWSQPPSEMREDRFGQQISYFEGIRIPPGGRHKLTYTVEVTPRAVQYDPPVVPLSALDEIDPDIRGTYLASNRLYQMDDPLVQAAAREARKSVDGSEPEDVRTLIENIADYMVARMTYALDDSWKDAATIAKSNTGSCSEYSFLFSALCRLNKVPTRLVGGIQFGDYAEVHETRGFHRWTEVWFPELGWIPVDVTKIDGAENSLDYEFLFGTPGYFVVVSQGDFDENQLGMAYYILRNYRGGRRKRTTHVEITPVPQPTRKVVRLRN
ncbi:Transglutaminase-like superfamily protein [Maioricimonas rarisocia]|uniref:Transglutaminase-like superfamily protein n=1 Tax=Maioricimonas rarisocia TaxID=2528026 RepID=A0A517Z2C9_9PLAN|nr:transglutaminase family protein [Maioricimonas rarisocia]QDU36609.1 Transglutaminase-like superfamily protein [Maioricimonas rarisocia]